MPGLLVVPGRPNVEVLLESGLSEVPAVDGNYSMPLDLDLSLRSQPLPKFTANDVR